ncbi:MAG: PSD1 and planctomycete cytochrome C domain-containing protein [Planctomycetota bacterium]|nr:PSD1 and planctomycete cytochrome C domain-containing protein [Planctomycetota bacterium]
MLLLSVGSLAAAEDKPTFESHVLPILKAKCLSCHSGEQPKAGLDLSTRRSVMLGGKSGGAVRRAAAESSLLWERIAAGEMPPKGTKLTAEEKGIIRAWINDGAVGEGGDDDLAHGAAGREIGEEARGFWSFKTPLRSTLPTVDATQLVRNPIDTFILHKLAASQLTLSPEADRRTLIRRAYFDLLGIPPAPEAVDEFCADGRPAAYERLIDQLLASPAYGERWARHWLDVAGYADSAGILSEDRFLPLAYRYRDYVIRAFNNDKPYDRFLLEQIAGDELVDYWQHYENDDALSDEIIEAITATGYLRCAPDSSRPDFSTIKNADSQYFYPTINDTMQIVATSVMGITLQCARCHDHMFDPIPQEDFYRVQAIFMGAFRPTSWVPQMERRLTTLSKSQFEFATQRNKEVEENVKKLAADATALREKYKQRRFAGQLAKLPEEIREAVRIALLTSADKRDEAQRTLAEQHAPSVQPDDKQLDELLPKEYPDYQESRTKLNDQIAAEQARRHYYDEIRAVYDLPGEASTPFLRRGDALTPGHAVGPGTLTVLEQEIPFQWQPPPAEAKTSGRRLAFARWLTDSRHPLTARVMVNRLWRHHFGEGIVSTPGDFGRAGSAPSHPELLDWLAVELVDSGWSIKHLHRMVLNSATYRQSSGLNKGSGPIDAKHPMGRSGQLDLTPFSSRDPENRLLSRQRLRRLEAEAIRDSVLSVAGTLRSQMYGTTIGLHVWPDGEVTVHDSLDHYRRSIYLQYLRLRPVTMLNVFDQPVIEINCTVRSRSTVSTQALTLLNSKMMTAAADAFAGRVLSEDAEDAATQAVRLAFGRVPAPDELQSLNEFLDSQQQLHAKSLVEPAALDEARRRAVADLCHMLLSANEFLYVD